MTSCVNLFPQQLTCSGNGQCISNKCVCDSGWSGNESNDHILISLYYILILLSK